MHPDTVPLTALAETQPVKAVLQVVVVYVVLATVVHPESIHAVPFHPQVG
jgi:hypothetical protein